MCGAGVKVHKGEVGQKDPVHVYDPCCTIVGKLRITIFRELFLTFVVSTLCRLVMGWYRPSTLALGLRYVKSSSQ